VAHQPSGTGNVNPEKRSSSGTGVETEVANARKHMAESQRGHHTVTADRREPLMFQRIADSDGDGDGDGDEKAGCLCGCGRQGKVRQKKSLECTVKLPSTWWAVWG
jgi:hypothetical protein